MKAIECELMGRYATLTLGWFLEHDFAIAFFNRSTVRKAKGDLDAAHQDYDQAIRLDLKLKD